MSKEEFLKIQTCVLKVNIHCDGCKHKVKKILQKIEGVYTTNIDSEQGKVTVSGNIDPATVIKKLNKNGKYAELWGAPKPNNNNSHLNNQFKNLQIDSGKGGNNKGHGGQKGQNQPKGGGGGGGGGGQHGQNPQLQQQLQQLKGFQDLKLPPQFSKMPLTNGKDHNHNNKSLKFNLPEDEGLTDDEFDESDDDDYDDDEFDDEMDDVPLNNNTKMMKPLMGNPHGHGGSQVPNMMMNNIMNGHHPLMKAGGGPMVGNNAGNNGGNAKKGGGGGGGNIPAQMNPAGGGGKGGKSGVPVNNNQNQGNGGGKGGKNGGQPPQVGKNGGQNGAHGHAVGAGGGPNNGNNFIGNGAKKGVGMNDGPHGMPNMMSMNGGGGVNVGQMGNMPMGQMGNLPMSQMGNFAAVQGLPASVMSGGGGAGHFPGAGPEHMGGAANPYYQQQMAAMMMHQQSANGNERFQPMMYARPPPAVNYMPPYPPYPYPPPPGERPDQYAMFSDENTSSCSIM